MNEAVKTLDVLANGGGVVVLQSGEEVQVNVCSGKVLPKVLRFVGTLSTDLGLTVSDADSVHDKLIAKFDDLGFLLNLISNYTNEVYLLVADLTSLKTVDKVSDLALDDLARVIIRVVEVNRDFFMKRVLPVLQAVKGKTL